MNQRDLIIKVLEKFKFTKPVSLQEQKKIFNINKRILKVILKSESKDSIFVKPVVATYYFFNNRGMSLSLKGSQFLFNFSTVALLSILVISIILPINYYFKKDLFEVRVISSSGNVDIIPPDYSPRRKVKKDSIDEGYIIKTGKKSSYKIGIGDTIRIDMLSNSKIKIKSIIKNRTSHFFLEHGTLYSKLGKLENPLTYIIETPNAIAQVKGTEFSMSYRPGKTIAVIKKGTVSLERLDIKTRKVLEKKDVGKDNIVIIKKDIKIKKAQEYLLKNINKISPLDFKKNEEVKRNSLKEIRKKYKRINVVTLYSGKVIKGVILSRGKKIKILTPKGIVFVQKDKVMNTKTIQ